MGIPYAEVIGDPIAHSKSPAIHKFWLAKLGIAGDYRAVRVEAGSLGDYLSSRRGEPDWRGCNVTIPHKENVLDFLDEVIGDAKSAGAVNTIVRSGTRLVGLNTDVLALRSEIGPVAEEAALLDLPIVLIGAGGAARAVLQAIRDVPGISVAIVNRDPEKAGRLLGSFGLAGTVHPLGGRLPAASALINASSLGMTGFPSLALDPADLPELVFDLVYAPPETELLRAARARGRRVLDGFTMLIDQARHAFQLFFSFPPPSMTDVELRERLIR